jgi:hypothetical protein
MNEDSDINEEKQSLLPYKPKLELSTLSYNKVNKYSFIRVENNSYSVPEYLVGKEVSVKTYYDKLSVYSNNSFVCEHKKIDGFNEISIDIRHYLKSFLKKPGALKNSVALKSIPCLKTIYDKYFITNPKKFIDILEKNKEKDIIELVRLFENYVNLFNNAVPVDNINTINNTDISQSTRSQIIRYDELCIRKAVQNEY